MNDNGDSYKSKPNRRGYEPRRFKSLVTQLHRESEQHRDRYDGQAPNEAPLVRVTRWLVVATIALATAGFLGFGIAILQWLTLRSTDVTMRRQLDEMRAEQRPWMRPDIAINDVTYPPDTNDIRTSISVIMKNVGNRPAINTHPNIDVFAEKPHESIQDVINEEESICARGRKKQVLPFNSPQFGLTLFPEEHVTLTQSYPIASKRIADNSFEVLSRRPKIYFGRFHVIGCITYYSVGDEVTSHQSGFVYYIQGKKINLATDGNDINGADLVVNPLPDGRAFFANSASETNGQKQR
jgi:hypothetical protein